MHRTIHRAVAAITAAIAAAATLTAPAQVTPGFISPTATDDMESYPFDNFATTITTLFNGTVPVTGNFDLLAVTQGNWTDFRNGPSNTVIPTSGSQFGAFSTFGTVDSNTLDFSGLPSGGILGLSLNLTAAGPGASSIEFFDTNGVSIGLFTDPDGFGPADGNLQELSFVSTTIIATVTITGVEIAFDDIAYVGPPTATPLGRIASSLEQTIIETQGTQFDTEIALWAPNGSFIDSNDDNLNLRSRLVTSLGPGTYTVAISAFNTSFDNGFTADRISGTSVTGPFTMTINGRRIVGILEPNEVSYFTFEVGDTVDPLFPAGPRPQIDLGVIAPGPVTIPVTLNDADSLYNSVVIFEETGLASRPVFGSGTLENLFDGKYVLAIQRGSVPSDNYQPGNDALPGTLQGSINGIPFGPRQTGQNEMVFIAFEIGTTQDPADLDMNGTVDVFDLIAFLQAFSAALNP